MRFLSLLTFFALFVGLTSCFPDASATLTPEVPEVSEEVDLTTNFTANGAGLEISYGYLFKVSEGGVEGTNYHLVLTATDVRYEEAFTGYSEAITITINAETDGDLSGEYVVSDGGVEIGTATAGRYFQNLRFSQALNNEQGYYNRGSVLMSRQGEDYVISLNLTNPFAFTELKGTFQGSISEVDLQAGTPADEELFQGLNQLKYGEREVELNHAYLLEYGNADAGSRRYRLYLSAEDIAPDDPSVLTGRSDLIFFFLSEDVIDKGGKFKVTSNNDYLSEFLGGVDIGYYCKNMDFLRNSADEDVPVDKGVIDIKIEDGEMVIAFTGESNNDVPVTGLFRGPLVRMN